MELSVAQMIGVGIVAGLVLVGLAYIWYANNNYSYLYRKPLRQAITLGIGILLFQMVIYLLPNFS